MVDTIFPLQLSKSLFMRGIVCRRALYFLLRNHESNKKHTASRSYLAEISAEVELLARKLFPSGVTINVKNTESKEQIDETADCIIRKVPALFGGRFRSGELCVRTDILKKAGDSWELFEVKSASSLKKAYFEDAAYQYYVLRGAGIAVEKVSVMHIDSTYVRDGSLSPESLFRIHDVTEAVRERQPLIAQEIGEMRRILKGNPPEAVIGKKCTEPENCEFKDCCWHDVPMDSILDLRGEGVDKYRLYKMGIRSMADAPRRLLSDFQRIQADAAVRRSNVVDRPKLKQFLQSLWHPLCFLDFEIMQHPVPLFEGMRPYQQMPFQYSLHLVNRRDSGLIHYEYLADPGIDGRRIIAEKLLSEIPEDACIIVYNAMSELLILRELAAAAPELASKFNRMADNVRDLMTPFRERYLYKSKMMGSFSLKTVFRALTGKNCYEKMAITSGAMAMAAYFRLSRSDDPRGRESIVSNLRQYCKLDSLAMVMILDRIEQLVNEGGSS
ncbi:MAG: DUF2779 domain-containing protein [Deltaproteobacteria bacterium]|nr:DUF2779 domain-containing protein [Deltaproteobacteria bacterium]